MKDKNQDLLEWRYEINPNLKRPIDRQMNGITQETGDYFDAKTLLYSIKPISEQLKDFDYKIDISGVYVMFFNRDFPVYVGMSNHILRRKNQHYNQLRKSTHPCDELYSYYEHFNCHLGEEDRMMQFSILEVVASSDNPCSVSDLAKREKLWMNFFGWGNLMNSPSSTTMKELIGDHQLNGLPIINHRYDVRYRD